MINVYHLTFDSNNPGSRLVAENEHSRAMVIARSKDVGAMERVYGALAQGPNRGLVLMHVADVEGDDLERAFEVTNHIDANWATVGLKPGVEPKVSLPRSTSVGDVMFIGDRATLVAPVGFIEFQCPNPATHREAASEGAAVEHRIERARA